jgi:hypothetical protein
MPYTQYFALSVWIGLRIAGISENVAVILLVTKIPWHVVINVAAVPWFFVNMFQLFSLLN